MIRELPLMIDSDCLSELFANDLFNSRRAPQRRHRAMEHILEIPTERPFKK